MSELSGGDKTRHYSDDARFNPAWLLPLSVLTAPEFTLLVIHLRRSLPPHVLNCAGNTLSSNRAAILHIFQASV